MKLALLHGSLLLPGHGCRAGCRGVLFVVGTAGGMWLYLAIIAYTVIWSLWEAGLDGLVTASRVGLFVLLGLYFLLPHTRRCLV